MRFSSDNLAYDSVDLSLHEMEGKAEEQTTSAILVHSGIDRPVIYLSVSAGDSGSLGFSLS